MIKFPRTFTAGDVLSWAFSLPEYSADDGWSAEVRIAGPANNLVVPTVGTGTEYTAEITQAVTDQLNAERAEVFVIVTDGSQKITCYRQAITVRPDPRGDSYDPRTHEAKTLDAIQALLEKKATKDQQTLTHDGQSLARYTFDQLISLEKLYRRRVAKQRRLEGDRARGRSRKIKMRFN